jgi:hypothetical protein
LQLHVDDIRGVEGEIACYQEGQAFPYFGSYVLYIFWPFFGLPFLCFVALNLLLDFCDPSKKILSFGLSFF